jgi:hypothetical protein
MPTQRNPFELNPAPRPGSYSDAYGGVPGALGQPDPFGDLASVYPNLSGSNTQLSSDIGAQLRGELSPETTNAAWDDAARYGITSGMPGGDLSRRRSVVNIGRTREQQQQSGIQNYLASLAGLSRTQTVSPELQSEIASRNATMNAAPVPRANAEQLQTTFDRNVGRFGGGGGGVNYPGMGRPGPLGTPPAQPNDFFANTNPRGTGFSPGGYGGGYISPLAPGTRAGGGGGDYNSWLDDYGLSQNFDPVFQYDPFSDQSGQGQVDYGLGGGFDSGQSFQGSDPFFGPGGGYDPTAGYQDNLDLGGDFGY